MSTHHLSDDSALALRQYQTLRIPRTSRLQKAACDLSFADTAPPLAASGCIYAYDPTPPPSRSEGVPDRSRSDGQSHHPRYVAAVDGILVGLAESDLL